MPAAYLEKFVPTVGDLLNDIPLAPPPPVHQPELIEPPAPVHQQETNEPPPAWVPPEVHTEPLTTTVENPEPFDPYMSVVDTSTSAPLTDDFPIMSLSQQPPPSADMFYQSDPFPNTNLFGSSSDPVQYDWNAPAAPPPHNGYEDAYTIPMSYPQPPPIDSIYDMTTSNYNNSSTDFPSFELPPPTPPASTSTCTCTCTGKDVNGKSRDAIVAPSTVEGKEGFFWNVEKIKNRR